MSESTIFKPLYVLTHSPINAHFSKNSDDFVVRELPLYEASGSGEHLMLHIQKKDLSTQEAVRILSETSGAKMREFGYAGLKDKQGLTSQFITMPAKFESFLSTFSHENLKILDAKRHINKLRTGHLKANSFFIRLKKVSQTDADKLVQALENIDKIGYANYFGYQRFGKFGDNAEAGFRALCGKGVKNRKINDFLISAFQSDLFNRWLSKRVEISRFINDFSKKQIAEIYGYDTQTINELKAQKQFFKLFRGDVMGHYPFGKFFLCEDLEAELDRFCRRDITCGGLILGAKSIASTQLARAIEDEIYANALEFASKMQGSRRFAWAYLEDLKYRYIPEKAHFTFSFTLQKGSYATVVLEEILHKNIFE
ncbi:MAG: tRNA pseudouridine(13) synthase TruD [Campylobacter sp.]|nr:tRNA pseudouridine(13) synthase TruD [Campylobacter sp.]